MDASEIKQIIKEVSTSLKEKGYEIRVLDLINITNCGIFDK